MSLTSNATKMVETGTYYHDMQGHILQIQLQRKEPLFYLFFETSNGKTWRLGHQFQDHGLNPILAARSLSSSAWNKREHRQQNPESTP